MPGPISNIANNVVPPRAVDEVSAEQSESGWRIRARKVIDGSDRFPDRDFQGTAIYPGVFVVESLLHAVSEGLGVACEIGSVRSARFLLPLMSGDVMILDATVEPTPGGMFLVTATVLCEDVGVAAELDIVLCRQEIADAA